eukprot:GHVL01017007.1.p1 GENE.GHVL01017007.1~~GHVL01017007.1.p1  ORF type:complete len:491 (+),score=120.61 GHVL01017007.1:70-1473(+)
MENVNKNIDEKVENVNKNIENEKKEYVRMRGNMIFENIKKENHILEENIQNEDTSNAIPIKTVDNFVIRVSNAIEESVRAPILRQIKIADAAMAHLLLRQLHLLTYFAVTRSLLLMRAGHVAPQGVITIVEDIRRECLNFEFYNRSSVLSAHLTSLVQSSALSVSISDFKSKKTLFLKSKSFNRTLVRSSSLVTNRTLVKSSSTSNIVNDNKDMFINNLQSFINNYIYISEIYTNYHEFINSSKNILLFINMNCDKLNGRDLTGRQIIESINIKLNVKFPLSLIFTDEVMEMYTRIYHLLATCAYAEWELREMWIISKTSKKEKIPGMHQMDMVRQSMQYFVWVLRSFITFEVVEAEYIDFLKNFKNSFLCMNDMINIHKKLLYEISKKCLLTKHTSSILGGILDSLELIHDLRMYSERTDASLHELAVLCEKWKTTNDWLRKIFRHLSRFSTFAPLYSRLFPNSCI